MFNTNNTINDVVDKVFGRNDSNYDLKEAVRMSFTGYDEQKAKEVRERYERELKYILSKYELVECYTIEQNGENSNTKPNT
jgi:hypothetical protein